jgi:hypothetical protein
VSFALTCKDIGFCTSTNLLTEQRLGVKFPSFFREKVMKDNGGSIERSKAKVTINRK